MRVEPITTEQFEGLLPLIADYQRFYEVEDIDTERNRTFFARFIEPSDDGLLLGAWDGDELVGYACLYWTFSSLTATEDVLMNDLYVVEGRRGAGIGRALIDASASAARSRGIKTLSWATAPDNERAQRLYSSTGATSKTWLEYELKL